MAVAVGRAPGKGGKGGDIPRQEKFTCSRVPSKKKKDGQDTPKGGLGEGKGGREEGRK